VVSILPAGFEVLVLPVVGAPPVTHIRSTLLMSSQVTLREAGLFERYLQHLPRPLHEQITQLGAPCWLPLEIGVAHYEACDQLGLSEAQVLAMASRVSMHREGSFLGIALNLARGAGITPLTVFKQSPRLWARGFMGGALGGVQLAPKELRVEVAGWPCAQIAYCRHALRGLYLGVAKLLCREAEARELPASTTSDRMAFQLSWD
jgi:hypothetical protein